MAGTVIQRALMSCIVVLCILRIVPVCRQHEAILGRSPSSSFINIDRNSQISSSYDNDKRTPKLRPHGDVNDDDDNNDLANARPSIIDFTVHDLQGLTESHQKNPTTLTIVCQLSGEFGNNISKFVHALVLWRMLNQQQQQHASALIPYLRFRIVLRHQQHSKWVRARDDIQKCFPSSLGQFDFELGNRIVFDDAKQTRRLWTELFHGVNQSPQTVPTALDHFLRIATDVYHQQRSSNTTDDAESQRKGSTALPFLPSDVLVSHPRFVEFVDDYYRDIRQFLQFHQAAACCALLPDSDETVYVRTSYVLSNWKADCVDLGVSGLM
jgi:hypothetical protein